MGTQPLAEHDCCVQVQGLRFMGLFAQQLLVNPLLRVRASTFQFHLAPCSNRSLRITSQAFWKAASSPANVTQIPRARAGSDVSVEAPCPSLRMRRAETVAAAAHIAEVVEMIKSVLKSQSNLVQVSQLLVGMSHVNLKQAFLLHEDASHALSQLLSHKHRPAVALLPEASGAGKGRGGRQGAEFVVGYADMQNITLPEEDWTLFPLPHPPPTASLSSPGGLAGPGSGQGVAGLLLVPSTSLSAAQRSSGQASLLLSRSGGVPGVPQPLEGGDEVFDLAEGGELGEVLLDGSNTPYAELLLGPRLGLHTHAEEDLPQPPTPATRRGLELMHGDTAPHTPTKSRPGALAAPPRSSSCGPSNSTWDLAQQGSPAPPPSTPPYAAGGWDEGLATQEALPGLPHSQATAMEQHGPWAEGPSSQAPRQAAAT
ncbi:hypothetical protein QJQ45_024946, partial [Haematococcus lacustris]